MQTAAIDTVKLAKILALTGSSHEAEALAALRAAQRQLATAGVSLTELIENPTLKKPTPPKRDDELKRVRELEQILVKLSQELEQKNRDIAGHEAAVTDLNHQMTVLGKALTEKERETQGWRERAWRFMWERDSR